MEELGKFVWLQEEDEQTNLPNSSIYYMKYLDLINY